MKIFSAQGMEMHIEVVPGLDFRTPENFQAVFGLDFGPIIPSAISILRKGQEVQPLLLGPSMGTK